MEHLRVNLSNVTTCLCGEVLINPHLKDNKFHLTMKICPKCSDEYIQMDKHYIKMAKARNKEIIKQEQEDKIKTKQQKKEDRIKAKQREKKAEKAREEEQIALRGKCLKCRTSVADLKGYCWECYKMEKNA